ncbi:MAG: hypothetical protein ABIH11_06000, partial [Candidatus Altiarchaeota archaeon]
MPEPRYVHRRIENVDDTVMIGFGMPEAKEAPAPERRKPPVVPIEYKYGPDTPEKVRESVSRLVGRLFDEGAVQESLTPIDPARGIGVLKLNKVVVEGLVSDDDRLAKLPRVDRDNGVLTLPFGRETPERDVLGALVTALRQPERPAEFELNPIGRQLLDSGGISAADLERSEDNARWRRFKPDNYSGGRSVKTDVPEVECGGLKFDQIKDKGVVRNYVL